MVNDRISISVYDSQEMCFRGLKDRFQLIVSR